MDDPKAVQKASCSLPPPDSSLDEEHTDWCTLHSLASLRLTLDCVIRDCVQPNQPPLVEFPLKTEVAPPLTELQSPLRTLPPRANWSAEQLALKSSQLQSVVQLYQDYIHSLQQGSRAVFGEIRGQSVCVLVDVCDQQCFGDSGEESETFDEDDDEMYDKEEDEREERKEFTEYKKNLELLFEEQLSGKKKVYLLKLGSEVTESVPTALNFSEHKQRCMLIVQQQLKSLRASGSCSLLQGLEKALQLTDVDTLLVLLGSRPDEGRDTLGRHMRERVDGNSDLCLHLAAHQCDKETADLLFKLASETGAHFHSYSKSCSNEQQQQQQQVEDMDIYTVKAQIREAEAVISELVRMQSGHLSDTVVNILRELYIANADPEHFPSTDVTAAQQCMSQTPVSSAEWLKDHSVNASRLGIYHVLAPNAYPQLKTHVMHTPDTQTTVPSVVYDKAMPQLTWHDGSQKYLHVDVHSLEDYQTHLEAFIAVLQHRLNWLSSGSRAPFGVIAESSVLLLVEFSAATLPFIAQLQSSLHLLLSEQLPHVTEFNIVRIGSHGESCAWQHGLTQQNKDTLSEAWAWLLGQSPAGRASLTSALDMALSGETYCSTKREVGLYLIVSSMPTEDMERICCFLREKRARYDINIYVIYYSYTPATLSHAVAALNIEEGCYANDQETTHCLQQIAKAGGGQFHYFKGPDAVGGDDVDLVLEELKRAQDHLQKANNILENYRHFCKRCVPPPPLPPSPAPPSNPPPSNPPPLYPRPTTAFLARMNATSIRIAKSASDSELSRRCARQAKPHHRTRHTRTYAFHSNKGFEKGVTQEGVARTEKVFTRKRSHTEDPISTTEWLSKFGLESLGLNFRQLEVQTGQQRNHKTTYKHINKKGEIVELYTSHQGLKRYVHRLKQARDSYRVRLNILSSGWYQFFGCIAESKVMFLVDTSSSMTGCFHELRTALTSFFENRPHKLKHFNMVAYSSRVRQWQEALVPCTDEKAAEAVQWISQLTPGGCSCLLHALKVSLESGVNDIYLITDGTADHTHDFLLSQLPQLRRWFGDRWRVNTIAFHCTLEPSHRFLKQMAHDTGGSYHSYPWEMSMYTNPEQLLQNRFLGDDVQRIAQEILTAEDYLQKGSNYL